MNESCHSRTMSHMCVSHVTYERVMLLTNHVTHEWHDACVVCDMTHIWHEWVMSHVNESCHICMSHVTCESWLIYAHTQVVAHVNESCHIWMSHDTYEWAMSHVHYVTRHIWMSHVTYERIMSHMDESCHICMSHVTYAWVMSHTHESCPIFHNSSNSHVKCTSVDLYVLRHTSDFTYEYGVASTSKLLKCIRFFCKRALHKRQYSARETYHFKEPTNRIHPIWIYVTWRICHQSRHVSQLCHSKRITWPMGHKWLMTYKATDKKMCQSTDIWVNWHVFSDI